MAYSNIWNEALPAGSEAANTIKFIFRNLKLDIDQRFIDIFNMPNFTDDPLRPRGLKFSDAVNSTIFLGDNAGTPRTLSIKDKTGATTYLTFGGTPALVIASGGLTISSGTTAVQALTATTGVFTSSVSTNTFFSTGTTGLGGQLRYVDDTNTFRWFSGISAVAASKDFLIYDAVNAAARLTIDKTTGVSLFGASVTSQGTLSSIMATQGILSLDTTSGATSDNTQILFRRGGVTKWQAGVNVTGINSDLFEIHNGTSSIVKIDRTTGLITFNSGLTVSAGTTALQALTATTGNFSGAITGNLTGNALTATTFQTARNINGVSFNGSADITIPINPASVVTADTAGISNVFTTLCTTIAGLTAGHYIIRGWYTSKSSAAATGAPQVQLLASAPGNIAASRFTYINPNIGLSASGASIGGSGLVLNVGVVGDTSAGAFGYTHHFTWWVQLSGTSDLTLQGKSNTGGETQAFGAGSNLVISKV